MAWFLPARLATSVWSWCHGLVGRQACWAASTTAQRRVPEPALDRAPVRERSPDRLIFGREREPEAVENGPLDLRGQLPPRRLLSTRRMEPRSLTRSDVLSTTEVAELLGIPRSTVHHLARRGQLPAGRVGRRWLFLRERIAAAVAPLDDPTAWRSKRDADRR